ncbi:MAG: hypothetical protein AAB542_03740 [Patescibacteria group bacterium]
MTSKQMIHKKIQQTRLFSDAQKVSLLVQLADASEEDKRKLEEGIDAFDREYKATMEKRGEEVLELLTTIMKDMPEEERKKNQDTIDDIVMGTAILQSIQ